MTSKKGFSLIEIVVTLIIIGIIAAFAVPSFINSIEQGAVQAAQNNLISIYNAQKIYYLGPAGSGNYYNSTAATDDQAGINTALSLNITDTNFNYLCATAAGPSYSCTATNTLDTNLILTVTSGPTPNNPNQIILVGATGCTNMAANPSCNPSCQSDVPSYCPS